MSHNYGLFELAYVDQHHKHLLIFMSACCLMCPFFLCRRHVSRWMPLNGRASCQSLLHSNTNFVSIYYKTWRALVQAYHMGMLRSLLAGMSVCCETSTSYCNQHDCACAVEMRWTRLGIPCFRCNVAMASASFRLFGIRQNWSQEVLSEMTQRALCHRFSKFVFSPSRK